MFTCSIKNIKLTEQFFAMSASTLSRFQGTLLGVLVGDCLGGPFEGSKYVSKAHLNKYFAKMLDPSVRREFKILIVILIKP